MAHTDYLLYAETAFHHQGDLDYLLSLVSKAKECGAQAIKFQMLSSSDALLSPLHPQLEPLSSTVLPIASWEKVLDHCKELGLKVVAMPLDMVACELVERRKADVHYLDIHSVSFYDDELMEGIKALGLPLILGVGGRTSDEIQAKAEFFGEQLKVLMLGFQAFPTPIDEAKLPRIALLKEQFPGVTIGYADHTSYKDDLCVRSSEYAYCLGARAFEKHLTLEEGDERLDSAAAMGPESFEELAKRLGVLANEVLASKETIPWTMTPAERKYRERQRVAIAAQELPAGKTLEAGDFIFRMTGEEGGFGRAQEILGRTLKAPLGKFECIEKENLE